jgi:Mce-associated membrane protein
VRPNAAKVRAKVEAEVKASGVSHADADRVNVLLYVDQTTTSTADSGEPQVALNRVQLSMVRVDGTWLVDDVTSY